METGEEIGQGQKNEVVISRRVLAIQRYLKYVDTKPYVIVPLPKRCYFYIFWKEKLGLIKQ